MSVGRILDVHIRMSHSGIIHQIGATSCIVTA